VDAAVMSEPLRVHGKLNWMPFYEEELVLLTSPAVEESDPMRILATSPYIRHTRHAMVGILAEEWLAKNKVEVRDAMEMASLENLTSMIAHDIGVSVVPNICVPDPIFRGLKKLSLGPSAPSRVLGILTRTDCSKQRLVQRLLEQIKQTVKEHAASPPI